MSTEREPVTLDQSPTIVSAGLAILAAILAVATSSIVSLLSLGFGILGLFGFAGGVISGYRPAVSVGTAGIVIGLLLGGLLGTPTELLVIGMVGTILAWDYGHNAISMGTQIGRSSKTSRAELAHAGASLLLGSLVAAVGYGIFWAAPSSQPISALVFLILASLFFGWIVRM